MRAFSYLVAAMLAVGAVLLAGAYLLPREVHVERTIEVSRPACTVYALVDGFQRQPEWSPWAALDPQMQTAFEGPERGVGATMTWSSAVEAVGSGRQQVIAADPCRSITSEVEFGEMGPSTGRFILEPTDDATKVTWSLDTDVGGPIGRIVGLFLDRWIGPDFERGLRNLKALAETLPSDDFAGLQVEQVDVPPAPLATVVAAAAKSPLSVGVALGTSFAQIEAAAAAAGLAIVGPPRAVFEDDGSGWTIRASLPVRGPASDLPSGPVRVIPGYAGPALRAVRTGADDLARAWAELRAWATAYKVATVESGWVEYPNDPATTPPEQLAIVLVLPTS